MPKLASVIIPTHNRPNYLQQAIESVLCQTYPHCEIIVVDDGSDSEGAATKRALLPYLSMPNFTYIYQDRKGVGNAVNRGLVLSQGEYIQRLDDDDRLLPEKIARSVEVFQAHLEVGLVATGYYHINTAGRRIDTYPPRPCPEPARLLNMLMGCISACAGVMVRSLVHQKVGMYKNIKAQDYEMWIRIARKFRVETINYPLAEYRRHPGSSTNLKSNQAKIEQDILDFTQKQLQVTPLRELVPDLQSEPHAYALRAAVYLLKDGKYVRTTPLARKELERAFQQQPEDPLLLLWSGLLAIHGDESLQLFPWGRYLPMAHQSKAQTLMGLFDERKRIGARRVCPMSPEIITLRKQLSRFRSDLIRETFRRATQKTDIT